MNTYNQNFKQSEFLKIILFDKQSSIIILYEQEIHNLLYHFNIDFKINPQQHQHSVLEASAHNKNNWAWTEKDFTDYANKKLKELFNFSDEKEGKYLITSETKNIKGEAFKYVRKNRMHISYDYKIIMEVKLIYDDNKIVKVNYTLEPFVDDEPEDWDTEIKLKEGDEEEFKQIKKILSINYWMKHFQLFIDDFQKQE